MAIGPDAGLDAFAETAIIPREGVGFLPVASVTFTTKSSLLAVQASGDPLPSPRLARMWRKARKYTPALQRLNTTLNKVR